MRIARFETIRRDRLPQLTLVRVHTYEGLTGAGDTYYAPAAVEQQAHQWIAPALIGRDPLQVQRHWAALYDRGSARWGGSGAELRDDVAGRPEAAVRSIGSADL